MSPHDHRTTDQEDACERGRCDTRTVAPEPGQVWAHETDGAHYVYEGTGQSGRHEFWGMRGRRRRPTDAQLQSQWHFVWWA